MKEQIEVKCPYCGYNGSDLKIGRNSISSKMMCAKCRRYFYPFEQNKEQEKEE